MKNTTPLLSIVVPIYNTERYLRRCVDSLLGQTLRDIEIILVNDGSPDGASRIMEDYAGREGRIVTIHQENGGLPAARNAGMAIAKGQYIGFVDSDDWVDPTMFESMWAEALRTQADVTMCDYTIVAATGKIKGSWGLRPGLFSRAEIEQEIYPTLIMDEGLGGPDVLSVWCCLYRRDFLQRHGITFDEQARYSEDFLFSLAVVLRANSFAYLKGEHWYCYRDNTEGISRTVKPDSWGRYVYLNQALAKELVDAGAPVADFERQLHLHMLYFALNTGSRIRSADLGLMEKRRMMLEIMRTSRLQQVFTAVSLPKYPLLTRCNIASIRLRWATMYLGMNWAADLLRRFR